VREEVYGIPLLLSLNFAIESGSIVLFLYLVGDILASDSLSIHAGSRVLPLDVC
jgi:hypothetical protein